MKVAQAAFYFFAFMLPYIYIFIYNLTIVNFFEM